MRRLAYIQQEKLSFSYHLADHCNLNCKGCDNYSPIAPAKFTDLNVFINDCRRIAELFNGDISSVLLLGGEPLLNPEICDFLVAARSFFPKSQTEIAIVTNGVLLPSMDDTFWNTCAELEIVVEYTLYPINIDYDQLSMKAKQHGVIMKRYGRPGEGEKNLQFDPFDLNGTGDLDHNFRNCFHANKCIQLKEGKLYTCNIRAYADIFCNHFNVKLELSDHDYVDIYSDLTKDEIMKELSEPIPFCKYCRIEDRTDGHVWRTVGTNSSIYDWLEFELDERAANELDRYEKTIFLLDESIAEEEIWNDGFNKRDGFECISIDSFDADSFSAPSTAAVIVSTDTELAIQLERKLYENGLTTIYICKII